MFSFNDPMKRGVSDVALVEEMDIHLLGEYGLAVQPDDIQSPITLAVIDLFNMRSDHFREPSAEKDATPQFKKADLESQRARFASEPALFDFLLVNQAFYVEQKPAEVLALIPNAARQERFSYFEYSRQMLRGLALDATKDSDAPRHWRDMLRGAKQPYQREALEIAMAMSAERRGDVASLFSGDLALHDPFVRKMILAYSAGPDLLRRQVASKHASIEQRQFALFVLLYKDLAQSRHRDFLSDIELITPDMGRGDKVGFGELERDDLRTHLPALEAFQKPYGRFP